MEKVAHDLDIPRSIQIVEFDLVSLAYGRCEVSVDLESIHIAHDQQGRIFKSFAILKELVVSCYQIFMLAFVLPAEESTLPHICPAMSAAML